MKPASGARSVALALSLCALGCRPSAGPSLGPQRSVALTPTQAELVIEQTLSAAGIAVLRQQPAELDDLGPRPVDFVFGDAAHGVEWLTPEDRSQDPEGLWPPPETGAPLRVIAGALPDGSTLHVLVLDQRSYLFEGNPRWVQRGAPGIDNAEDRLRTDLQDFLDYVRSQDRPLTADH